MTMSVNELAAELKTLTPAQIDLIAAALNLVKKEAPCTVAAVQDAKTEPSKAQEKNSMNSSKKQVQKLNWDYLYEEIPQPLYGSPSRILSECFKPTVNEVEQACKVFLDYYDKRKGEIGLPGAAGTSQECLIRCALVQVWTRGRMFQSKLEAGGYTR